MFTFAATECTLLLLHLRFREYILWLWSVYFVDSQSCMLKFTSTFSSAQYVLKIPIMISASPLQLCLILHRQSKWSVHRSLDLSMELHSPKHRHIQELTQTFCPHCWSTGCHGQRHSDRQYLRWPYPEQAAVSFIKKTKTKRRRTRNIRLLFTDHYLCFLVTSSKPVWPVLCPPLPCLLKGNNHQLPLVIDYTIHLAENSFPLRLIKFLQSWILKRPLIPLGCKALILAVFVLVSFSL